MSVLETATEKRGVDRQGRILLDLAAVLTGLVLALAFGGEMIALAKGTWSDVVLPAYFKLLESGYPWC